MFTKVVNDPMQYTQIILHLIYRMQCFSFLLDYVGPMRQQWC